MRYAVIEITKPISYMDIDYYFQVVPYEKTKEMYIYVKRGSAGHINLSTKNIKVLRIFDDNQEKQMNDYLSKLRKQHSSQIDESIKKITQKKDFINLRESIIKTLRENIKIPTKFRRRIHVIEKLINNQLEIEYYHTSSICLYENKEKFVESIINKVVETIYYSYMSYIEDESKEWQETATFVKNYINDNYRDNLFHYYQVNCG